MMTDYTLLFSRLSFMNCSMHLDFLRISSAPGETVTPPPLPKVFKHIIYTTLSFFFNCNLTNISECVITV